MGVLPLKLIPTRLYISYQAEEKQKLTQLLAEVSWLFSPSKNVKPDLVTMVKKKSSSRFKSLGSPAKVDAATGS